MSFETVRKGAVEYLVSTLLETPHCFTTRSGGVSEGYLASMNLGFQRGDRAENVLENFRILGQAVGFRPEEVVLSCQIHSTRVDRVGAADRGKDMAVALRMIREGSGNGALRESVARDGTCTDEKHTVLAAYGADCPTILFHDPVKRAVAAVHAGWRGTAAGMAAVAVRRMAEEFGSEPRDLRAAIGPCICRSCFEVHGEVPQAMLEGFGEDAREAIEPLGRADEGGEKYLVDLRHMNELWLRRAGVTLIDICPACTACEPDRFWSHRYTGGHRGSQASFILLDEE